MRIDADGTCDDQMADHLDRAVWFARRKEDGTPHVRVNKLPVPLTRSGAAVLTTPTDEEVLALSPGSYVMIADAPGSVPVIGHLVAVRVLAVRLGAWEIDREPVEVPVVDVELPNGRKMVYAVDDLVVVELLSGEDELRYIAAHAA